MRLPDRLRAERGFTLVETLAASLVLLIGLTGMFLLVATSTKTSLKNRQREGALALAREVLESARGIQYSDLTPAEILPKLKAQPGLADAQLSNPGYTIKRRGTVFTIEATVCSYDDPGDQSGPHDAGGFCADTPGGAGGGTLDFGGSSSDGSTALGGGTPDDYKRVVVAIKWKQGTLDRQIVQRTIIQNPGNSTGPAITLFKTNNASITTAASPIAFQVKTSSAPALLNWSVDGTVQGSIQNPGTDYTFNWPVTGLVDGTYIVAAQAFDSSGLSGAQRSITMTLNRNVPQAPTGLQAGRNGSVVELEWLANPERDISGYRVYRVSGSTRTRVCPATGTDPLAATSCQDTSPPATGTLEYVVVALDKDTNGAYREGADSAKAYAPTGNTRPNAPTGLAASTAGTTTVLRWTAPVPADPDAGDSIAFYRIYRDGVAYEDRYDRTGTGSALSYTDNATGGRAHTYYVTAVDTRLAESTAAGPVTK